MFPWVILLTTITLALLPLVLNFASPKKKLESTAYAYSIGFRVFIWVGSIIFCLTGFIFKYFGIEPGFWDWVTLGLLGSFAIFGCIYTDKYMVELGDEGVIYGAFVRRSLPYTLIQSSQVVSGNPRVLVVRSQNHKTIKISGNLQGFGELVRGLEARLAKGNVRSPGASHIRK